MGDGWPASDLEMMKQSVNDYLSADQQFQAWGGKSGAKTRTLNRCN